MTCRTWARCFLSTLPMKTAWRVSGVVMRRWGGWRACFRRSCAGVSPCLTPTVIPSSLHHHSILCRMSRFRDRRGVMYRARNPGPSSRTSRSKTGSIADSVFPEPVGAMRTRCRPSRRGGMAAAWGSERLLQPRFSTVDLTLPSRRERASLLAETAEEPEVGSIGEKHLRVREVHALREGAEAALPHPGQVIAGELVEGRHDENPRGGPLPAFCVIPSPGSAPARLTTRGGPAPTRLLLRLPFPLFGKAKAILVHRREEVRPVPEGAADLVPEGDHGMVVPDDEEVAEEGGVWVCMAVEVPHAVDEGPPHGQELPGPKE